MCWGGRGTGEDITSYELQNYQLVSAGAGGQYYPNDVYNHGGGGGGVLVDGAGPDVEEENKRGETLWSHGQGYGGGGTFHSSSDRYGHSGVIILEIVEGN